MSGNGKKPKPTVTLSPRGEGGSVLRRADGGEIQSEATFPSFIPDFNVDRFAEQIEKEDASQTIMRGRVRKITGLIVQARLPNGRMGEMCTIEPPGRKPIRAQIVGFNDEDVFLTPLDPVERIGPKTPVINRGHSLSVGVSGKLLGRVVDSVGDPIDGRGIIESSVQYPIRASAPGAMERQRIVNPLPLGVRAVDALLTVGEGQRVGVFSSAGVGKSSLLGMIARNSTADVNVVALVGERGREVKDFLEDTLGPDGLGRSVVVVSTSDEPPLRRVLAAYTATAIAEYFRDQGKRVNLLMDSVTRFARALREIALSVGEPPVRQGFPPSVFAALPELLERAGRTSRGSITAFYTILLASEQIEDPLGEEIRAILDGHLYLSSRLAYMEHYPAIDILQSNSRIMNQLVSDEHRKLAERIRRLWAIYEDNRDLISIGAYKRGTDPTIDEAIKRREAITRFLVQSQNDRDTPERTLERALAIFQ